MVLTHFHPIYIQRVKMKKILLGLIVVILTGCSLASEASPQESITIASWNVQNLFDGSDDGTEYPEYTKDGYWSDALYRLRLSDVETVLCYDKLSDADIIVLNEVENENVVKDILELKSIKKRGFRYYACAGESGGAIKTAVISRLVLSDAKIHSVDNARPVLEVCVNSGSVHILAVHGKSKAGNEDGSADLRLALGKTLFEIADGILNENPYATVVIAGDMNEDWTDGNLMINSAALNGKATACPLVVSPQRNDMWYCFWLDNTLDLDSPGSYYYGGKWSCIDNILLSDGSTLIDAGVVNKGILRKSDLTPDAWIRNLASGVSDHFPVWVELKIKVVLL